MKAIDTDGNLYGKAASLDAGEIVEYENFDCASKDDESYIVLTLTKEDFQL